MPDLFNFESLRASALKCPVVAGEYDEHEILLQGSREEVDLGPFSMAASVSFHLSAESCEGYWIVAFAVYVEEIGDRPLPTEQWTETITPLCIMLTRFALSDVGDPGQLLCMHRMEDCALAHRQATDEERAQAMRAVLH